jgi:hypothetical protein
LDGRSILHLVADGCLQRRACAGLLQPGPAVQLGSQRLGCGDQQRLEVAAGVRGDLDGAATGKVQHPQRFAVATLARVGELLAGERFPAGADSVKGVAPRCCLQSCTPGLDLRTPDPRSYPAGEPPDRLRVKGGMCWVG